MGSHIGWRGERSIAYKSVETSPYQTGFKTLRGSSEGNAQRRQYLLAVSLSCYKWYQSQTPSGVPARTLGPQRRWIVRFHVGWIGERIIAYKGAETSLYQTPFKTLRGIPKGKVQIGQYSLVVGLSCYINYTTEDWKPSVCMFTILEYDCSLLTQLENASYRTEFACKFSAICNC